MTATTAAEQASLLAAIPLNLTIDDLQRVAADGNTIARRANSIEYRQGYALGRLYEYASIDKRMPIRLAAECACLLLTDDQYATLLAMSAVAA